jgi:hypothetical protein
MSGPDEYPTQPQEPRQSSPAPRPTPLAYRASAADREARRAGRIDSSPAVALGCAISLLSFVGLVLLTLGGNALSTTGFLATAWIGAGPALLALGVWSGIRNRNWGFFFGVLASILIVVGLIGLIAAICGR